MAQLNREARRLWDREQKRVQKQVLRKESKSIAAKVKSSEWTPWIEASEEDLQNTTLKLQTAYKNSHYVVMVCKPILFEGMGEVTRIMIRDNLARPHHSWLDFQRIKNELFGEEFTAYEVYPPASNTVNDFNIYHLWVMPKGYKSPLDFGNY